MDSEQPPVDWQWRTIADARTPRDPTRYIIDKYIATHTLNVVFGAPGSLKSMLVLDAALNVACGQEWMPGCLGMGKKGLPVERCPVLWIDLDNGRRRTDERVDAVSRPKGMSADDPFYYISMPTPSLIAHDVESMALLKDDTLNVMDRHEAKTALVVIDNLGLVTGTVEENSAEMAQVMKNFRWLAEETGAGLIIIHHQRKGSSNGGRAGDALRGHSSIEASLDLALHVTREANTQEITIKSTKTRGVDVPVVVAEFRYEHVPDTNDLQSAWFEVSTTRRGSGALRNLIKFTVEQSGEIVKSKLCNAVYDALGGEATVRDVRAEVENMIHVTGDLTLEQGLHNSKVITLPKGKKNGQIPV